MAHDRVLAMRAREWHRSQCAKLLEQNGIDPATVAAYGMTARGYVRLIKDRNGRPYVVVPRSRGEFATEHVAWSGVPRDTVRCILAEFKAMERTERKVWFLIDSYGGWQEGTRPEVPWLTGLVPGLHFSA